MGVNISPYREKAVKSSELSRLAEARGKVYKLLSALFIRPPNRDFLRSLNHFFSQPENIAFYETIPGEMVEGLRAISACVKAYSSSHEDESLLTEFTRLLRGVRRGEPPLPPYESLYRGEGTVFGSSTSEVSEEYRKMGLELADSYKGEPPDHIGVELDFMSHLCGLEEKAWGEGDHKRSLSILEAEKRFLEGHILVWIHRLCSQIRQLDSSGFYRGVAKAAESWAAFDHEQIDAVIRSFEDED